MKNILKSAAVLFAVVALSSTAYSQGTIGFGNSPGANITYECCGSFADSSTTVALYYSADTTTTDLDSLTLGGTTPVIVQGLFSNGGNPLILPLDAGTPVLVEIRAWDNGAADWDEAIAPGQQGFAGRSGALNIMNLGGGPSPTPNLVINGGFAGFGLTVIPEPSTIALGILGGLGAMVLLRRRK